MQGLFFEDLSIGQSAETMKIVGSADVEAFAAVSGDTNPVHLDEAFASRTAYRGRIAHGLLSASFGSAVVGTILPGAGSIYISQTLAFHQPVRIDDEVRVLITVVEVEAESARVKLSCEGFVGETLIMDGIAVVRVPRRRKPSAR